MKLEDVIPKLEEKLIDYFSIDKSGHDIYHLQRVMKLALQIQEQEGGDRFIIGVAALLHDVHRVIEEQTGKYCSPKDSLPKVEEILSVIQVTEEQKKKILHCIEYHDTYSFDIHENEEIMDKETLIIQDTDNLDGIGAIGIARAFMVAGARGVKMWEPKVPISKEKFDESKLAPSEVHHFYDKLLKLKDNMNTETGKKLAKNRHEYMEGYLKQFFAEWDMKR